MFPQDTNAYNTLFGGRLLSLMDKAGGIACAKFAHREFVTISIDTLTFIAPARQGDLLEVSGQVVYTSSHGLYEGDGLHDEQSDLGEEHHLRGLLFLRRHRFHDAPHSRPQFTPESEEELAEWAKAKAIRDNMLAQKAKREG